MEERWRRTGLEAARENGRMPVLSSQRYMGCGNRNSHHSLDPEEAVTQGRVWIWSKKVMGTSEKSFCLWTATRVPEGLVSTER
jgi:hypothetical protein